MPLNPGEVSKTFQQMWLDAFKNPAKAGSGVHRLRHPVDPDLDQRHAPAVGRAGAEAAPVAAPEPGDKRFSAPDWQRNAAFDALKQSYLLSATTLLKSAADVEGLDPPAAQVEFYLRQFIDAISPDQLALHQPAGHPRDDREWRPEPGQGHPASDARSRRRRDQDDRHRSVRARVATWRSRPARWCYRNKLIELIQYAPTTETVHAVPLVFIPPWINKYYILDMQPQNSLIKFLVDQGFTVFVISWKNPDASMEDTTFDDYLELGPLAALDAVKDITGSPNVNPVGYCIGGTLLSMTLPYLAATGDTTVECRDVPGGAAGFLRRRRHGGVHRRAAGSATSSSRCSSAATWTVATWRRCSTCCAPTT